MLPSSKEEPRLLRRPRPHHGHWAAGRDPIDALGSRDPIDAFEQSPVPAESILLLKSMAPVGWFTLTTDMQIIVWRDKDTTGLPPWMALRSVGAPVEC